MKKLVLFIIFLVVAGYFFSQTYAVKAGTTKEGKYSVVVVNKKDGKIYQVLGK